MADKNFKVKNKLVINGLAGNAGPLIADGSNIVDSTPYIATQYGGTGTTTSPSAGQVLYSSGGTTYAPTTLSSLVQGAKYQADAPTSPATGDIWIESDSTSDSFDPNIIRRQVFTATAGQTTFTTSIAFIQGYEQVYFNGLLLLRTTDYTTPTTTTVILASAAAADDIIEVVTITNLNSTNTYTQAEIDSALSAKLSTSTASSTYLTQSNASSTYAPLSNPTFTAIGGSEGGQINFAAAPTNTTLSGNINLDVYQNRVRLFEGGGNTRGAYIDLTTLSNGVGSELIAASPQSGNSGKYLTTNGTSASWATPSSGGMTLINTGGTTLTGATVTIGSIPGTYKNLQLVVRNYKPANSGDYLMVYVNGDTNSRYNRWPISDPSTNGNTSQTWAETNWGYVSATGETTLAQGICVIDIWDYANTSTWKMGFQQAINNNLTTPANVNFQAQLIHYNQTSAISSISLITSGGNFSSGTAYLYGVS